MIAILHLIDDPNVGGVTCGVADLARRMGPGFAASVRTVPTMWRLAPRLAADVVVVDFTLSWAKLPFLLSLRLRCRGRLIIVEHSYTEAYERQRVRARSRFRILLRLCFRLADRVVAVSDRQAARPPGCGRPGWSGRRACSPSPRPSVRRRCRPCRRHHARRARSGSAPMAATRRKRASTC
ncbi:MAG: glycosyltransferase family 4 protein [Janthinobacterium lividum]